MQLFISCPFFRPDSPALSLWNCPNSDENSLSSHPFSVLVYGSDETPFGCWKDGELPDSAWEPKVSPPSFYPEPDGSLPSEEHSACRDGGGHPPCRSHACNDPSDGSCSSSHSHDGCGSDHPCNSCNDAACRNRNASHHDIPYIYGRAKCWQWYKSVDRNTTLP